MSFLNAHTLKYREMRYSVHSLTNGPRSAAFFFTEPACSGQPLGAAWQSGNVAALEAFQRRPPIAPSLTRGSMHLLFFLRFVQKLLTVRPNI